MSRRTRVLLLDEPTSALTERETAKLFAALRQLKQEGITIIYISHKLDEIMAIADRLTVLKDGKVAGALDIADATKEKIVRLMVGRELSALYPEKSGGQSTPALTVEGLAGPGFRDVSFCAARGRDPRPGRAGRRRAHQRLSDALRRRPAHGRPRPGRRARRGYPGAAGRHPGRHRVPAGGPQAAGPVPAHDAARERRRRQPQGVQRRGD